MNITGFLHHLSVRCWVVFRYKISSHVTIGLCCCPAYLKPCNLSSKTSVPLFFQPHTSPLHPLISQSILLTSPFEPPFISLSFCSTVQWLLRMAPPLTRSLRPCSLPWPQCRAMWRGTRSTKLHSSWNNFRNRLVFIRIFLLFRWWRERDGRDGVCFEAQLDDGGVRHGGCGVTLQQRNTTGGGKALTDIKIFTARGVDSCPRDSAV